MIDFVIPIVINLVFLIIVTLILWPMGKIQLSFQLGKGFIVFWLITLVSIVVVAAIQRRLRMSIYEHFTAFVISNLIHGLILLSCLAAFVSIAIHNATESGAFVVTVLLWIVGVLSCAVAHLILTTFHKGTIYALSNFVVTIVSFAVFGIWPALAQKTYGWLFDLF